MGEEGIENLKNKRLRRRGGKKSLLTDKQLEKLPKELESRPANGGIWTEPKVACWIEKENCVEKVWNQRGWDYLKKAQILLSKSNTKSGARKKVYYEGKAEGIPPAPQKKGRAVSFSIDTPDTPDTPDTGMEAFNF